MGQRTWGRKGQGLEQASPVHVYIQMYFRLASCKWNREVPGFHKFQQFISWLQKLPSEMEICNQKLKVRSTRVLAADLPSVRRTVDAW